MLTHICTGCSWDKSTVRTYVDNVGHTVLFLTGRTHTYNIIVPTNKHTHTHTYLRPCANLYLVCLDSYFTRATFFHRIWPSTCELIIVVYTRIRRARLHAIIIIIIYTDHTCTHTAYYVCVRTGVYVYTYKHCPV